MDATPDMPGKDATSVIIEAAKVVARCQRGLFAADRLSVEDIGQECVIAGIRAAKTYRVGGTVTLRNWVIRAMRCRLIDLARKGTRTRRQDGIAAGASRDRQADADHRREDAPDLADLAARAMKFADAARKDTRTQDSRRVFSEPQLTAMSAVQRAAGLSDRGLVRAMRADRAIAQAIGLRCPPSYRTIGRARREKFQKKWDTSICAVLHIPSRNAHKSRRVERYITALRDAAHANDPAMESIGLEMLDAPAIARSLGVTPTTLRNWRRRGLFPAPDLSTTATYQRWFVVTIEKWIRSGGKIMKEEVLPCEADIDRVQDVNQAQKTEQVR